MSEDDLKSLKKMIEKKRRKEERPALGGSKHHFLSTEKRSTSMVEFLQPGASLSRDFLWQSSLFLTAGLAACLVLRRHPASRSHLAPGHLRRDGHAAPVAGNPSGWMGHAPAAGSDRGCDRSPVDSRAFAPRVAVTSMLFQRPAMKQASDLPRSLAATTEIPVAAAPTSRWPSFSISWKDTALGSWFLLSGLAIVRLLVCFIKGLRMVRNSVPVDDAMLLQAASRRWAAGADRRAVLWSSPALRCPSVWCWVRRPILLVPAEPANSEKKIDWVAVFCHERRTGGGSTTSLRSPASS